ncbi:MAG: polyphosphate kinase 1 [Flavobacteriales bacterium]
MTNKIKKEFLNREISWLSFNERVLQEAEDKSNPLIERLRFLGIFSNNQDEFFKVRVATLTRAKGLSKKPIDPMDFDPRETLAEIHSIVLKQQQKFDRVFTQLLTELKKENIHFVNEGQITPEQKLYVEAYFESNIRPNLVPLMLSNKSTFPELNDTSAYLAIELGYKTREAGAGYALIEIPHILPRFVELPATGKKKFVMFIDDVIRYRLRKVFGIFDYDNARAFTIKITRDAELDVDDDLSKGLVEKMSRSLTQRKKGQYVRINYDHEMPPALLEFILRKTKIKDKENIIPGSRYHNKKDLMKFPDFGRKDLCYEEMKPVEHPALKGQRSILEVLKKRDILVQYPYQPFTHIIDLLREAAIDPAVRTIRISLYRVAKNSQIINALISAARNGKRVIAVIELQARFDEENNITITRVLQDAGARVIPGVTGLKVHSKLIQISRKEDNKTVRYVHIGTGNFNEKTSAVYSDVSLLTSSKEIGTEVRKIFEFFESNYQRIAFRHLIVSPFGTRRKLNDLINAEIVAAQRGKPAWMTLKMNNLVDASLIRKLYEASEAGVKINIIIRGTSSLIPGVPGKSSNIHVKSIVGRYLEHSRILVFCHGQKPLYYISSADWMTRNLDHRIEVTTPIYDPVLKKELQDYLDLQLDPNAKARIVEKSLKNEYVRPEAGKTTFDAQQQAYLYFKKLTY